MKDYATNCGEMSWQTSKVTNMCDKFEHQLLVDVKQQMMKSEDNGRAMQNLPRTSKNLPLIE